MPVEAPARPIKAGVPEATSTPAEVTSKAANDASLLASFSTIAEIEGLVGACLVDSASGLMVAAQGSSPLDMDAVAALGTEVVRAERAAIAALEDTDALEDILVTMGQQLHIIHVLEKAPTLFLYVVLDRSVASLGLARMHIKRLEGLITP